MCRLRRAGDAAARRLVGVPSDVLRFLVGQELAGFRLATCLCISLVAEMTPRHESERAKGAYSHICACSSCHTDSVTDVDKVEIISQCKRCQ